MHFVFNCICLRLYFVLRPQVYQLVPRQPLTQVVRLFFAVQLNSPIIQPLFSLHCFIRRRCHPRVEFCVAAVFSFYSSSYLQLFGFFYIHSNTLKFCLQAYVFSSQKILYFFSKKIICNTVSGLISQSNQFLLQTIYQGQNSDAARMRTAVDAYIYIYI